jgi:hypothetical protein
MRWYLSHANPAVSIVSGILLFVVAGINISRADSLSPKDVLEQFDQRLFLLQPDLKEGESDKVDVFVAEGVMAGYSPAYYIRGLRNKKIGTASVEADKNDLIYALKHGVRNAALFIQPMLDALGVKKEEQAPYNREALKQLSQNSTLAVSELSMKSILTNKTVVVPSTDSSNTDIVGFGKSALKGSILSAGFLLRHQGLDVSSIDIFCAILKPSDLAKQIDSCRSAPQDERRDLVLSIFLEHEKNLQTIYQEHYGFYKSNLCKNLSGNFPDGPVCLDIIEFVLPICRLDYSSSAKQVSNPVFVCSKSDLAEYFGIYSDLFKQTFNMEISEIAGK